MSKRYVMSHYIYMAANTALFCVAPQVLHTTAMQLSLCQHPQSNELSSSQAMSAACLQLGCIITCGRSVNIHLAPSITVCRDELKPSLGPASALLACPHTSQHLQRMISIHPIDDLNTTSDDLKHLRYSPWLGNNPKDHGA
jgi:hypothetical protein